VFENLVAVGVTTGRGKGAETFATAALVLGFFLGVLFTGVFLPEEVFGFAVKT